MANKRSLPTVPDSMIFITGEEGPGLDAIECFFVEVVEFLGYPEAAIGSIIRIDERQMFPSNWVEYVKKNPTHIDSMTMNIIDYVKMLVVGDVIVASAIYWRDVHNYVQLSFALYLCESNIERAKRRSEL